MPKCECGICKYCKKRAEYLRNRDSYILRASQYQKDNRDKTNEKNLRWKKNNPDKVKARAKIDGLRRKGTVRGSISFRKHDLKRNYGVNPEWWDSKFDEQGRVCGICGCSENNASNRRMHIDHSHITNQNRGILCHRCNTALERLESIPEWAAKAQLYLDRYEKEYWDRAEQNYKKAVAELHKEVNKIMFEVAK